MYIPKYICTTVLLFYCHAHARPRRTTSLQGLSYPRATLRMLRDLMTTPNIFQTQSRGVAKFFLLCVRIQIISSLLFATLISKTVVRLWIAWKAILLVTPYIRVKRECAGHKTHNPSSAWRAVHRETSCAKANHVQPSRLVGIVIALYPRASSPSSSMHLGYS